MSLWPRSCLRLHQSLPCAAGAAGPAVRMGVGGAAVDTELLVQGNARTFEPSRKSDNYSPLSRVPLPSTLTTTQPRHLRYHLALARAGVGGRNQQHTATQRHRGGARYAEGSACRDGAESATLTGETLEGQAIEGTDSIHTVGCRVTRRPAIWMKAPDMRDTSRSDGPKDIERR